MSIEQEGTRPGNQNLASIEAKRIQRYKQRNQRSNQREPSEVSKAKEMERQRNLRTKISTIIKIGSTLNTLALEMEVHLFRHFPFA